MPLIAALGLRIERMTKPRFRLDRLPSYSDESVLNEIRRVCRMVKSGTLTTNEFSKHSNVGLTTVRRRFGGWKNALASAGFAHLYNMPPNSQLEKTQLAKRMSDSEVLAEVSAVARKLNKNSVTVTEFNANSRIGVDTLRRRFGSWKKALELAGLGTVVHGRRYSDKECFENLLEVWVKLGRVPKYKEMSSSLSQVGGKAYVVRWGTWNKALHAFTEHANSKGNHTSIEVSGPKKHENLPISERREIPLALRYQVLKRDEFRCVLCGRSPATTTGLELQVDHIDPWSKGGKTVIENLRAACKDCNLGKGNKIETSP